MRIPELESKDIAFFLAVKPYMSPNAQQLLDLLLVLINPKPQLQGNILNLDPVPILNLLSLLKNLSESSAPKEPVLELPQIELAEGEEERIYFPETVEDLPPTENHNSTEEKRGEAE